MSSRFAQLSLSSTRRRSGGDSADGACPAAGPTEPATSDAAFLTRDLDGGMGVPYNDAFPRHRHEKRKFEMSRRCSITGKGVMAGNNVSHAHNKTRRRFLPNLQATSVFSHVLGKMIRMRISTAALRTIEHRGGLDSFLLSEGETRLAPEMRRLKRKLKRVSAATAPSA